jgi:O-glycosyl hydrolase
LHSSASGSCENGDGHAIYADQTAWGLLDIVGVHQYDTQVAEPWPADVLEKRPVWQTEMSGVNWWPEQGPSTDIDNGVAVAGWIHNALTVGEASAWFWWWWKALGATNESLLLSDGTIPSAATRSASVPITIAGGTAPASLTPWITSASDNLVSKAAITVSGGTFTAELAGTAVTTFIEKWPRRQRRAGRAGDISSRPSCCYSPKKRDEARM